MKPKEIVKMYFKSDEYWEKTEAITRRVFDKLKASQELTEGFGLSFELSVSRIADSNEINCEIRAVQGENYTVFRLAFNWHSLEFTPKFGLTDEDFFDVRLLAFKDALEQSNSVLRAYKTKIATSFNGMGYSIFPFSTILMEDEKQIPNIIEKKLIFICKKSKELFKNELNEYKQKFRKEYHSFQEE